jgi:signal transduction histidine kinase
LLNWSRARISGNFSLKPELIILSNIIQQNITLFNAQIEQKELIIENNIDLKHCVYADFNQLDLVLRNVIINAIKFSFVGGKIITSSFMKDESCMISVQDFGTGMTQKDLNSINQGDLISSKTGTSGEKGTGIGLIISRDFVIQNKGILQIKSELQKGSTIVIELPRA